MLSSFKFTLRHFVDKSLLWYWETSWLETHYSLFENYATVGNNYCNQDRAQNQGKNAWKWKHIFQAHNLESTLPFLFLFALIIYIFLTSSTEFRNYWILCSQITCLKQRLRNFNLNAVLFYWLRPTVSSNYELLAP